MSIIKRRKTSHYAQIHNNPLQGGLKDLRAVGLLSHVMSLPETWVLHKTQLQSFYTRKNVDAGWKELAVKSYAIGFSCYKNGKLNYFYNVSDVPFTNVEFEDFVIKQIEELQLEGFTVRSPSPILHSSLVITDKITNVLIVQQTDFTDVPGVQYSENSTDGTYKKKQCIKEIGIKEIINNNNNNNNKDHIDMNKIDEELKREFPDVPFEEIKDDMFKNHNYDIKNEKQYRGSLKDRIVRWKKEDAMKSVEPVETHKPKKQYQPRKKSNHREESVPEWFGKQKKKESAPAANSNIDEERRKLLEELNQ